MLLRPAEPVGAGCRLATSWQANPRLFWSLVLRPVSGGHSCSRTRSRRGTEQRGLRIVILTGWRLRHRLLQIQSGRARPEVRLVPSAPGPEPGAIEPDRSERVERPSLSWRSAHWPPPALPADARWTARPPACWRSRPATAPGLGTDDRRPGCLPFGVRGASPAAVGPEMIPAARGLRVVIKAAPVGIWDLGWPGRRQA